jgi:hypothetical protein
LSVELLSSGTMSGAGGDLRRENEDLRTELFTKAGEVSNLRERLAKYEKDLNDLRAQNHSLLQHAAAGRAAGGSAAVSRDATRVKELEREIVQIRTNLEFRENDSQQHVRKVADLEKTVEEKDRLAQEERRRRDSTERELQQLKELMQQQRQDFERQQLALKSRETKGTEEIGGGGEVEMRMRERLYNMSGDFLKGMRGGEREAVPENREDAAVWKGEGTSQGGNARRREENSTRGARDKDPMLVEGHAEENGTSRRSDSGDEECAAAGMPEGSQDVPGAAAGHSAAEMHGAGCGGGRGWFSSWEEEKMDLSAVFTNSSAQRVKIVKALLHALDKRDKSEERMESFAGASMRFGASFNYDICDSGELAADIVRRAMLETWSPEENASWKPSSKGSVTDIRETANTYLKGDAPVERILHDLQCIIAENIEVWLQCTKHANLVKSSRTQQRMGMAVLHRRSRKQLEVYIPALDSLLTVSDTCRKCLLEDICRELDKESPPNEVVTEGAGMDDGAYCGGGGEKEKRSRVSSGATRDGGLEDRSAGKEGAGKCSLSDGKSPRARMSTVQVSVGNGQAPSIGERPGFVRQIVELLHSRSEALRNNSKRSSKASMVESDALVVHLLQILQLLLEECDDAYMLQRLIVLLDLRTKAGVGDSLSVLLTLNDTTSLAIKSRCLSVLSTMDSCPELSAAICPDMEEDESVEGVASNKSRPPQLLFALIHVLHETKLQIAPTAGQQGFAAEDRVDAQRSLCHAVLRVFNKLCATREHEWVQLLLRHGESDELRKDGYLRLQVCVGNLIVDEVRRLIKPHKRDPRDPLGPRVKPRALRKELLLLREALSLLWIFVVATHQVEGARVHGFWGVGVWVPLLAALRRLENDTAHPELKDLSKLAERIAALLHLDCVPGESEGGGAADTQMGTSEGVGTLTMQNLSMELS